MHAIAEDLTKKSFREAAHELVLEPAGMNDSFFEQPLSAALVNRAATAHDASGKPFPGGWRVIPELAAGGLWSTPMDLAKLLIEVARAYRGEAGRILKPSTARDMFTRQNGGPYGLAGAISGGGQNLVLMKRGQNPGYQNYMMIFPETGQGIVIMTGSDHGTLLATALVGRAAAVFDWPPFGDLLD